MNADVETKKEIVTSKDPILAQIGELIDARVTQRILAYHNKLVEDYGLVMTKPKSSVGDAVTDD